MEQIPFLEANSHSINKFPLSWNTKFHYYVYKSLTLAPYPEPDNCICISHLPHAYYYSGDKIYGLCHINRRDEYRIGAGKRKRKEPLGRTRHRIKGSSKIDCTGMG
jgi:hypothetical protein